MLPRKKSLSKSHQQYILFSIKKNIGFIKLNRPEALNALNPGMMASIRQRLLQWRDHKDVHAIIVHSNCERAFCAGGDLKAVYKAGTQKQFDFLDNLFREEYLLNHVIKTLSKPYISFVDGIVMGGGIGLMVHGSHRLLSEKTTAAMPETNIGFFPDVGASYFFNQSPGKMGLYLALTGNQFDVGDALYAQIGTHYIPHDKQADLMNEIKSLEHKNRGALDTLIHSYAEPNPTGSLQENEKEMNTLFDAETLSEIFKNLDASSSAFAKETLDTLNKRSPTSLAVTFEQLKRAQAIEHFADIMSLEFDLSQTFVRQHDFFEGIRAAVIDKDRSPTWSPKNLGEISQEDIEAYFKKQAAPLIS